MGQLKQALQAADPILDLNLRILKLENRLQRERLARLEAEAIAERGLSEQYRQLMLLETIATKANQSAAVDDALRFALKAICDHTRCRFGNVYMLADQGPRRLLPTALMHGKAADQLMPFINLTRRTEFPAGHGLPGRVLESGEAAWISDVAADPDFLRAKAAAECGLHAAFAFPVLVGKDVVAVMEFFFKENLELNAPMLAVMSQIGTQLGRVMERRAAENRLIHDASHDPLTGLPNRLLFVDRLERAVAAHRRRPEIGFAVLFIDLDGFKLVNDSLGHAAGDALLIEIAARLLKVLSSDEEKGVLPTLARLGGDEFTVLLEELHENNIAPAVAERLQQALRRPLMIGSQQVYTTASIGIAASTGDYASAADIMRDADLAMYRAKSEGRARVEVFDQSLHDTAMRRLSVENDLRGALQKNEFVLHYQPVVALNSGIVVGFEALLRWQRGPGQLVPPADFISVAEETGLIVPIGNWVMREAFATIAAWHRAYPWPAPLTMSVNVSPRQFDQADFVEQVLEAVKVSSARPETIRLEITESVALKDPGRAIEILRRLHEAGVRVSVDDFGTGYSSLSYLQQLPFDTLKIDRSFINALQKKAEGGDFVRTILDLARNLNMDVVAEGAETQSHVEQLRDMGCGFAQGYYFSRPLERDAAAALLAQPRRLLPPKHDVQVKR